MIRKLMALLLSLLLLLPAPALADTLSIEDCLALPGESAQIIYTLPATCKAALHVTDESGNILQTVFTERVLLGGLHMLTLDPGYFNLPDGCYTLLLTSEEGSASALLTVGTPATPTPEATQIPTEAPTAVPTEVPTAEPTAAPQIFTPAMRSEHRPEHENCYWCTNMDITDEDAVWAMLASPITAIDIGQKEQLVVRSEPDAKSEGIGVVTGTSQAVHVLEKGEEWTLVELYSSSFHDSKVKNYNGFITGYVPTDKLETREVNQTYGMVLDKLTQKLYIFKEGKLFTTLLASTGLYNERQPYNETRSGEFIIISRVGDFKSDSLVCGMGLRFNGGDLLHEVPHVKNADGSKNYKNCEPKLGTRASHGCVRIQRRKNADGINMTWIWNNIKVGTKLVIWEDWQGRRITPPDPAMSVYYNPDGGSNYHAVADCGGVKEKFLPLTAFTYGELDEGAYAQLTPCAYCTPEKRLEEIEEINREHEEMSPGDIMAIWEGKK